MSPAPGRRLQSGFEEADSSPGFLLWRITNRWQAAQRAALKQVGLTHVQFVLLACLTWLGGDGPVTQRQLADHAATDEMMTSQVLRVLEQQLLITRAAHPHDARAKMLTVTARGRELANRAIVLVEECDRMFFASLDGRLQSFIGDLGTLAAATSEVPKRVQ